MKKMVTQKLTEKRNCCKNNKLKLIVIFGIIITVAIVLGLTFATVMYTSLEQQPQRNNSTEPNRNKLEPNYKI